MSERTHDVETRVWADPYDPRDRPFPPDDLSVDKTLRTAENELRKKLRKSLRKDALSVKEHSVKHYRELADPTWYQRGEECVGFALGAIADFHFRKEFADRWDQLPSTEREDRTVSRRMLYEMAQVYDRAEYDEGSTLRGALKGWRKSGVARDVEWPYEAGDEHGEKHGRLSLRRVIDAVRRPGGLYLRIDKSDTANMKKSLLLDHPLFVSANHHVGWINLYLPDKSVINQPADGKMLGGHAFVIVGFDERGWWVHNSWGQEWGDNGYALLPYEDFEANGQDVWFVFCPTYARQIPVPEEPLIEAAHARPGAADGDDDDSDDDANGDGSSPIDEDDDGETSAAGDTLAKPQPASAGAPGSLPVPAGSPGGSSAQVAGGDRPESYSQMWRHVITIGDDGLFTPLGTSFGMNYDSLKTMMFLFRQQTFGWATRRLAIFADGGYWSTSTTVDQLAPLRDQLMENEIYPIFLLWDTPWYADMQGRLYGDAGLDEDDVGEDLGWYWDKVGGPPMAKFLAAAYSVPTMWNQMQRRAHAACGQEQGVGRQLAKSIEYNLTRAAFELHLIGHGSGDLLLSRLAPLLSAPIRTCNLWAPATTMDEFDARYRPLIDAGRLEQLTITTLDDEADRNDRMGPLPGSPLQLVSDVLAVDDIEVDEALELYDDELVWQNDPEPVLGLERFLPHNDNVARLRQAGKLRVNVVPRATHTGLLYHEAVRRDTINAIRATAFNASSTAPFNPPSRHDTIAIAPYVAAVDPLEIIGGSDPLTANVQPL